jgi:hypothetical protein
MNSMSHKKAQKTQIGLPEFFVPFVLFCGCTLIAKRKQRL